MWCTVMYFLYVYVCLSVCLSVCAYVCMYVRMYVRMYTYKYKYIIYIERVGYLALLSTSAPNFSVKEQ